MVRAYRKNTMGVRNAKTVFNIGKGGKALKAYTNPNPAIVCPGDKVVIEVTDGF